MLKIEEATINDYKVLAPLVIDFEQQLNVEHKVPPLSIKEIKRSKRYLKKYLLDNSCVYLVYKESERILGYTFLSIDDKDENLGFINELFVVIEERQKGIANKLLTQGLQWFKEKKCDKVQLTVNRKNSFAIKLYNKIGFTLYESDYIDMRIMV